MLLGKLIEGVDYLEFEGDLDLDIRGLTYDSREVEEGFLFVAIDGFTNDGHDYIERAVEKGAKAIVATKNWEKAEGVSSIKVREGRRALAILSSNYFENPSEDLGLVGITGTNGKTSITYMLKNIMEENNKKIGLIGTMGSIINGEKLDNKNTTPESYELQRQISQMARSKTDYCFMEVSSHSLDLHRVDGLDFEVGVFTNLTEDHLDFHLNMENYFKSKKQFFYMTRGVNIINADDDYGRRIIEETRDLDIESISYGLDPSCDLYASDLDIHHRGLSFRINYRGDSVVVNMKLVGEFNVYNSLAAAGVALYYGFSLEEIKKGLESIEGIEGRFQLLDLDEDFSVIIDFAHTPDSLEQVLKTLDDFTLGRKILVFGAGGNRDKLKRPIMGRTAGENADFSIVTSDNPRYEDPDLIIEDILLGLREVSSDYIAIRDRKEAIEHGLRIAKKGDTILLAGKGHEAYTIIGDEVIPFNEKEIVLELIEKLRRER